jgi:hypothetical protein
LSGSLLHERLHFDDVLCYEPFGTLGNREFHRFALAKRFEATCLDGGVVDENVTTGSALNESIALLVVKPL